MLIADVPSTAIPEPKAHPHRSHIAGNRIIAMFFPVQLLVPGQGRPAPSEYSNGDHPILLKFSPWLLAAVASFGRAPSAGEGRRRRGA
ncbi:hypothetical protein POK33_09075 [Burkholderia cenocepacia]|uniref:hypothetical protein n=1 Tax=Burkholderia cenocepacia TaxID=95486 RepID=UPI0023B893A6|nr:hypothetical protein [Burkholderia cenocepacia]MDF0500882.1 hypothetical protein [Burkholderia cenocepacia]MDT6993230.1 hypothetical protein [Burkholderia cenocepacia]